MGHTVEEIAKARGHEIVSIIDADNLSEFDTERFRSADVAIEFTTPDSAWSNLKKCWEAGIPVVSGTTGWQTELVWDEINRCCAEGATLLWSPNFSIGLNVTQAASRLLAKIMSAFPEYNAHVHEIHHIHKKDHPSGSAIMLANGIVDECDRYQVWLEQTSGSVPGNALPVTHERIGEVPGVHEICWDSEGDTIILKHEAKNRKGFATGAVWAAEWLVQSPKGHLYTMKDVLNSLI